MVVNLSSRLSSSFAGTHRPLVRRLITVVTMACLSLALMASGAAAAKGHPCRYGNTPIYQAHRAQMQRAVVCLINKQRRAHGLPRLQASSELNRSAQGWTNNMVSHRDFSHGTDFSVRISAVGFDWSNIGENIATGYQTPNSVVAAWMASPGHCRNILTPTFREVGTGVSPRSIAGSSTIAGTWTQDFGLLMNQHPAVANWGPADACPYK
jgi:uncharacterized protein YkwD